MATQQSLAAVISEAQRLAGLRLDVTARERHQKLTVKTLEAMLRQERKTLRAIQEEKSKAEDDEEFHRSQHDLEPGSY